MYDYVLYNGVEYQTKAFDCTMSCYQITNKKLYVKPNFYLTGNKRKKLFKFTGSFCFYDIEVEYQVEFIDGKLMSINEIFRLAFD